MTVLKNPRVFKGQQDEALRMKKCYGGRALKEAGLGHEPPRSRQIISVIRTRVFLIPALPAGNPSGLPFTRCELTPATFRVHVPPKELQAT